MPKGTHDAVLASAHLTTQLHHIISRDINALENGVVTIGKIESGDANNVIAEKAFLEGSIRWFEQEMYELITSRMNSICKGVEASYNVTIDLKFFDESRPVINNKQCYDNVVNAIKQVLPNTEYSLPKCEPTMLAEDFGEFLNKVPGCFFFVGARQYDPNSNKPSVAHHTANFSIDEKCLLIGCQLLCTITLDQLFHDNNEVDKQNQQSNESNENKKLDNNIINKNDPKVQ